MQKNVCFFFSSLKRDAIHIGENSLYNFQAVCNFNYDVHNRRRYIITIYVYICNRYRTVLCVLFNYAPRSMTAMLSVYDIVDRDFIPYFKPDNIQRGLSVDLFFFFFVIK